MELIYLFNKQNKKNIFKFTLLLSISDLRNKAEPTISSLLVESQSYTLTKRCSITFGSEKGI